MSLHSMILATTSGDRPSSKDNVKKVNEQLCTELDSLAREHKKLKQIIEHLKTDYNNSKGFDPLRRYEKLKGMIKRTVMHLKLNPNESLTYRCKDVCHQAESARRREDKYTKMSRQELHHENVELQDQLRELRRRCSIIRDLVDDLQKCYDASKRVAAVKRYAMLKAMIKRVINDELV